MEVMKEIGRSLAKSTSGTTDSSSSGIPPKETHTYQFRKDFKLSGQIGDAKFELSFTSYMR